jgi:ADP-heptose:LPS heptosyltransferase
VILQAAETGIYPGGVVSYDPLSIYAGILGQIGDIVMFSATVRRLRELFPNSRITLAVSSRYREAGELVAGLPYVDRLFVTQLYFEKLTPPLFQPWERGWPVDLRGDDEIAEERRHDLVLPTRPRHFCERWWEHAHQVEETAATVGVPGPIDCRTEIAIPPAVQGPPDACGRIVLHNDPAIDARKAWPWERVHEFVRQVGPGEVVLLGNPGPPIEGTLDLRGRTSLAEAAAIIRDCACYVGIDSGLMWIAGSLQVPTVGLYGTGYVPRCEAVQPVNPQATYLQVEGALAQIPPEHVHAAVARVLDLVARHPAATGTVPRRHDQNGDGGE